MRADKVELGALHRVYIAQTQAKSFQTAGLYELQRTKDPNSDQTGLGPKVRFGSKADIVSLFLIRSTSAAAGGVD